MKIYLLRRPDSKLGNTLPRIIEPNDIRINTEDRTSSWKSNMTPSELLINDGKSFIHKELILRGFKVYDRDEYSEMEAEVKLWRFILDNYEVVES